MSSPERTVDVDPRILFAAERTHLAWVRTGIAIAALGFVGARFGLILRELGVAHGTTAPTGATSYVGIALVLAGGVIAAWATVAHDRTVARLYRGETVETRRGPRVLGVFVALASLVLAVLLVVGP